MTVYTVCLSFAVNTARFGNVNADEFTPAQRGFFFYVQNEMLCTMHIIVSFPMALLVRYSALAVVSGTIPHQTTL